MEVTHKEYSIEAFETEKGRWRARIRRTDGHKIKDATGVEHDFIDTQGQAFFSAEGAIDVAKGLIDIDVAKGLIDRGGMSKGSAPGE